MESEEERVWKDIEKFISNPPEETPGTHRHILMALPGCMMAGMMPRLAAKVSKYIQPVLAEIQHAAYLDELEALNFPMPCEYHTDVPPCGMEHTECKNKQCKDYKPCEECLRIKKKYSI